jgi:uncharacterized protein YdaT
MNENQTYVVKRDDGTYGVKWGGADRVSAVTDTQAEAIRRAREIAPGVRPHVERVRDTDVGGRDKWRHA